MSNCSLRNSFIFIDFCALFDVFCLARQDTHISFSEPKIREVDVKGFPHEVKALFLGLVTAQVLATIQVHLSNEELYLKLEAIRDAGYLAIPNQQIMDTLRDFGPALCGGIFFTLTVGAGLSLLTLSAVWLWVRVLRRRRIVLLTFLLPWVGFLYAVNHKGFSPMVTSYFVFIPPVVFLNSSRGMKVLSGVECWREAATYLAPIFVLALLWTTQMDKGLFTGLRDHLLLSNPFGLAINDFYYKYTLYPAEAFKSLDQKTLKTWRFQGPKEEPLLRPLESAMFSSDYVRLQGNTEVDLTISKDDRNVRLEHQGKTVMDFPLREFLLRSRKALREFSQKTDRYDAFRRFTFLSLLIAFPITLYSFLRGLFFIGLSCFLSVRNSSILSSVLCLLTGFSLLFMFHEGVQKTEENVSEALVSSHWQTRVAALRRIEENRMDIGEIASYRKARESPHILERIWLARALGVSRNPETYEDLISLLDDPHPNVVCTVFHSLGQRGDRRAIDEIKSRIMTSDHWYEQWYAYNALRALGWKQAKSE